MNEVAEGCDALVIATEWEEFKKLDLDRARKALTHPILFDGPTSSTRPKWSASGSSTRASDGGRDTPAMRTRMAGRPWCKAL